MEVAVSLLVVVLAGGLFLLNVIKKKRHQILRAEEICRLGDLENIPNALESLQPILNSDVTIFRDAANKSVAKIHARLVSLGQADIAQLIQLSNDQRFNTRRFATRALGEINSSRAVESLIKRLIDNSWDVRREATTALVNLGETAKNSLFSALKDTNPDIKSASADILRDMGVPSSNPLLIEYRRRIVEGKQVQEDFQRSIAERKLKEKQRKNAELGNRISTLTDEEIIDTLTLLCNAYSQNDRSQVKELEPLATKIGEELSYRGGLSEMRRIFYRLKGMRGSRTLEMHWGGIGGWQG